MTLAYFAIGSTLAGMVNFETYFSECPNVHPNHRIAYLPPSKQRLASARARRDGFQTLEARWESVTINELVAFIYAVFGNFTTASKSVYVTWIDETNHWSPFLVELDKPQPPDDYTISESGDFAQQLVMQITNPILQSVTLSTSGSVTTSQRLVYVNTAAGDVTLDLPALAGVGVDTVYSYQVVDATNDLILKPDGSETISNLSSLTLDTLHERVDIVKETSTNWKLVSV